jgi:hypothetical protein
VEESSRRFERNQERKQLEIFNTEPDLNNHANQAHEMIFLHSKESSVLSEEKDPINNSMISKDD